MAKVLLVDTGFSAQPIREHLLASGHEVWVLGGRQSDAMSRHSKHWVEGDYSKPGVIETAAKKLTADFVVPGCTDLSWINSARAARELRMPGFDHPEVVEIINHKHKLRQLGAELGLSMPRTYQHLNDWLHKPVMIKPVDSFSGKGVIKASASSIEEQHSLIDEALQYSPSQQIVVEDFAQGQLYSHSCMLLNREVASEVWVKEMSGANPWVVDTSFVDIESVSQAVKTEVRRQIAKLASHLGLADGLLHTQMIVNKDEFWLIEMTRRCPGDLYSQLVEMSLGNGYVADYCAGFTGGKPARTAAMPSHSKRHILRHTLTQMDTVLFNGLKFKRPLSVCKWVPLALTGDQLQPSPMGRMALLFAECANRAELAELAECAAAKNLFELEVSHA